MNKIHKKKDESTTKKEERKEVPKPEVKEKVKNDRYLLSTLIEICHFDITHWHHFSLNFVVVKDPTTRLNTTQISYQNKFCFTSV